MEIGGLQKVSLIDYPETICAVVFTRGCNFRCLYCHNPELVDLNLYGQCLPEDELFSFLAKRKGKLDGVSITGGEPTIQPDIIPFIQRVKKMGYSVKIDTNGSKPDVILQITKQRIVDYIAMDIKGPLEKYKVFTQSPLDVDNIVRSIAIIMDSGIPYEFRTTVLKSILTEKDILKIGKLIKNANLYVLQKFISSKALDQKCINMATYTEEDLEIIKRKLMKNIHSVIIR
jgi:pyruvate formate lyase activating enzyme